MLSYISCFCVCDIYAPQAVSTVDILIYGFRKYWSKSFGSKFWSAMEICKSAETGFLLIIIYLLHLEVNYICLLCVCLNVMCTLLYYCFGEFLGYVYT